MTRYNNVTPNFAGTANHPAPQRHAAFTTACVPSPNGTDSRKRTFHGGRTKPHGTATSQLESFSLMKNHYFSVNTSNGFCKGKWGTRD